MAIPTLKGKAIPAFNPVARAKIAEVVEGEMWKHEFEIKGSYRVLMEEKTAQKAFEKLHKAWALAKPKNTITAGVRLSITHCFTDDYDAYAIRKVGSAIRNGFSSDFIIEALDVATEKSKEEKLVFKFGCYFDPEKNQFRRGDYF